MSRVITNKIGEILRKQGITQKQLSVDTGITESAISRYIKGERVPREENLMKIAKALGITTDELLDGDIDRDLEFAKSLIERNASKMSKEEKMEIIKLLIDTGGNDEIKK
ncbi:helix-turn-helix domain-containing protein [Lachnospira multipara]|uniref:helix-turn-helix domain-containing protein n=1 Tax=Lachnospira multipara TaxID=28051 RepID=UPI0004E13202|nr:helix-turn-helix transcriptional regulator [Lachnospira multipara]